MSTQTKGKEVRFLGTPRNVQGIAIRQGAKGVMTGAPYRSVRDLMIVPVTWEVNGRVVDDLVPLLDLQEV